jgi:CheY-like chemotaxis protein
MDIQMPLADGTETLRRLRSDKRFSNLKVFAVTGSRRIVDEGADVGGWDGWFQKPVDLSSLVRRIRDDFANSSSFDSSLSV